MPAKTIAADPVYRQGCLESPQKWRSRNPDYWRRYREQHARWDPLAKGRWKSTLVANFAARIVNDIILDDGEEERRDFGVEAELGGRRLAFTVPAAEFGRMGWVLPQLGPEAIIYPGQQQHARAAIQMSTPGGILAGAEITATQETTQVAVSTRTNGEGQIDLLRYLARLQAQAAAFRAVT